MAKKTLSILLVLVMVLGMLSGCSGATKEYTCKELTMTVPLIMSDESNSKDAEGFTFALSTSKIAIFGLRETFTQLGVDDSFTAKDYAEAVIEANGLDARVISRSNEDYEYFRYNAPADDGTTFRYLVGVYKTYKAFWMVQVTASIVDYEEETFFDYLDSVKFD